MIGVPAHGIKTVLIFPGIISSQSKVINVISSHNTSEAMFVT